MTSSVSQAKSLRIFKEFFIFHYFLPEISRQRKHVAVHGSPKSRVFLTACKCSTLNLPSTGTKGNFVPTRCSYQRKVSVRAMANAEITSFCGTSPVPSQYIKQFPWWQWHALCAQHLYTKRHAVKVLEYALEHGQAGGLFELVLDRKIKITKPCWDWEWIWYVQILNTQQF